MQQSDSQPDNVENNGSTEGSCCMQVNELSLVEHTPEWAALLAAAFERPYEDMLQLLTWLHQGFKLIAWGAWVEDRLVAQYTCLLRPLYLPETNHVVQVGMSVNMAVHPDYRGRGLIKQVAQPVYDTVYASGGAAGVGFSNAKGVQVDRHSTAYGYRVCGQLQPIAAPVPFRRRSQKRLELSDRIAGQFHSDVFSRWASIHFMQTGAALQHRYEQHPFRRYQFGLWREGDCILGVVIYRRVRVMGMPAAALLGAYGVNVEELLCRWMASLRDEGIHIVHLLSSTQSVTRRALASIVPLRVLPHARSPYYLTVKPLDEEMPASLLDYAAWDCTGGDVL
ncbi:MAG: GNAT family N-acetyltransferase [Anaerolineae bacterium]